MSDYMPPHQYPTEEAIERARILTGPDAPGFDKPWALAIMRGLLAGLSAPQPEVECKTWRDPKDKPPHLPGKHHSQDVLLLMNPRRTLGFDDHGIRIGHVWCGHWRPSGGNGNFDADVLGWMPLPDKPGPQPRTP